MLRSPQTTPSIIFQFQYYIRPKIRLESDIQHEYRGELRVPSNILLVAFCYPWAQKNVPQGATVLVETYAPALTATQYQVLIARGDRLVPWSSLSKLRRPSGFYGSLGDIARPDDPKAVIDMIEAGGVDDIFLSNWVDRYRAEKTIYGKELAMYELVLDSFPTVRTYSGADADRGPMIRVLRVAALSGTRDAQPLEQ